MSLVWEEAKAHEDLMRDTSPAQRSTTEGRFNTAGSVTSAKGVAFAPLQSNICPPSFAAAVREAEANWHPTVKDSGARQSFDSGMVRDVTEGKTDYSLVFDGPMLERWARHLTAGAQKYDKRNWMKASGPEERERFKESAIRHFVQWVRGDQDEDHAAAVFFNINGMAYVDAQTRTNAQGFTAGPQVIR